MLDIRPFCDPCRDTRLSYLYVLSQKSFRLLLVVEDNEGKKKPSTVQHTEIQISVREMYCFIFKLFGFYILTLTQWLLR